MNDEINVNLLLDRLYTTGKIDKKYMWALEHYITNLKQENEKLKKELNTLKLSEEEWLDETLKKIRELKEGK